MHLKPGILDQLQKSLRMTDQEFSDHIGISRSQLWRVKMDPKDKRFSLGKDLISKLLIAFPSYTFEDLFFLDQVSHACNNGNDKEGDLPEQSYSVQ